MNPKPSSPMRTLLLTRFASVAAAMLLSACQVPTQSDAVEGSTWHLSYDTPAYHGAYDVTFGAGGKLHSNNVHDKTPDNDRWQSDGEHVQLIFNDGYATFEGKRVSPDLIEGTASVKAGSISWQAKRKGR